VAELICVRRRHANFSHASRLDIPDDLASHFISVGKDAARTVLEDALVQVYRENKISASQLMTSKLVTKSTAFSTGARSVTAK
jgi:hypothetical protein